MKIDKVGFYKTRRGDKVRVFCVDGPRPLSIFGYFVSSDSPGVKTWNESGQYSSHIKESVLDLVSEWKEPEEKAPEEIWVNMYKNNRLFNSSAKENFYGYVNKKEADENAGEDCLIRIERRAIKYVRAKDQSE